MHLIKKFKRIKHVRRSGYIHIHKGACIEIKYHEKFFFLFFWQKYLLLFALGTAAEKEILYTHSHWQNYMHYIEILFFIGERYFYSCKYFFSILLIWKIIPENITLHRKYFLLIFFFHSMNHFFLVK